MAERRAKPVPQVIADWVRERVDSTPEAKVDSTLHGWGLGRDGAPEESPQAAVDDHPTPLRIANRKDRFL